MNKYASRSVFAFALLFVSVLSSGCQKEISVASWTLTESDERILISAADSENSFPLKAVILRTFDAAMPLKFGFSSAERTNLEEIRTIPEVNGDVIALRTEAGKEVGSLSLSSGKSKLLRVSADLDQAAISVLLEFDCRKEDRFWGLGAQYNYIDLKNRLVPIWTQEQGVGRKEGSSSPPVGSYTISYFPVPWIMNPDLGTGLLVADSVYSEFDLCYYEDDVWRVEVWDDHPTIEFMSGDSPRDLVSQLADRTGKLTAPVPDWALSGVWLAAQGGRDKVEARLQTALDADIPVTALWVQDWVGLRHFGGGNYGLKYRWVPDRSLYPGLETMITNFNQKGVRFLGYMNNFIIPDFDHYEEAVAEGYLIHDQEDKPYTFPIVTFEGSILDVSNEDAVSWYQDFAREAAGYGMQGWMCDFGEWLPFDAKIAEGMAPAEHNLYPTKWHAINREVLEEVYDDDWVMFSRSGFTGEQKTAQVVWIGDQEANWSESDGLPTVVKGVLSLGMSGVPLITLDIGGFSGGPREEELFMRWTELGAFSPVMRTHDGLQKKENHHFDSTVTSLTHFKRMADIHEALLPYWKELVAEARESGLPVIRHTILVDPEWDQSLKAHDQWMIGDDMLLAPVVHKDRNTVQVSLPEGNWVHLLTGDAQKGRTTITVGAPLGTPAVFVRKDWKPQIVSAIRALN